jgi:hypothetical protein
MEAADFLDEETSLWGHWQTWEVENLPEAGQVEVFWYDPGRGPLSGEFVWKRTTGNLLSRAKGIEE